MWYLLNFWFPLSIRHFADLPDPQKLIKESNFIYKNYPKSSFWLKLICQKIMNKIPRKSQWVSVHHSCSTQPQSMPAENPNVTSSLSQRLHCITIDERRRLCWSYIFVTCRALAGSVLICHPHALNYSTLDITAAYPSESLLPLYRSTWYRTQKGIFVRIVNEVQ
jgi:hypothetical protein